MEELRGPVEVFPAFGASGVTLDSTIRVRYSAGFLATTSMSVDSLVTVTNAETGESIPGSATVLGDTLVFTPAAQWSRESLFDGVARGLDEDMQLSFITGGSFDVTPPVLPGALVVESSEVGATCDTPDGFRIDVSFPQATDVDGARGDIEYLLFLTRAPRLTHPLLVARIRNFASSIITMAFVLENDMAVGSICVALNAVDSAGHVVSSGETCSDPLQGSYFASLCSASAPTTTRPPLMSIVPALFAASLLVARRKSKRRS